MSINKLQNNITTLDIISKTNDVVDKTNITSGGWVFSSYNAYSYPSTLTHTQEPTIITIDLFNYLPNDNEIYEVQCYTGCNSGANIVYSTDTCSAIGGLYTNNCVRNQLLLTVGPQRKVYLHVYEKTVTGFECIFHAYKQVTSDINHKLEDDLSNLPNTSKALIKNIGNNLPSNTKYIDLVVGASKSTYVAPANGWIVIEGTATSTDGYITSRILPGINENKVYQVDAGHPIGYGISLLVPCTKNVTYSFGYEDVTISYIRFYYAVGSENEYGNN